MSEPLLHITRATHPSLEDEQLPPDEIDGVVTGVALVGQVLLGRRRPVPARGRRAAGGADGADGRVVPVGRPSRRLRGRRRRRRWRPVRGRVVRGLPRPLLRRVVVRPVRTLGDDRGPRSPGSPRRRRRHGRARGGAGAGGRGRRRVGPWVGPVARVVRVLAPEAVGGA